MACPLRQLKKGNGMKNEYDRLTVQIEKVYNMEMGQDLELQNMR
jgi:hypothetical protein